MSKQEFSEVLEIPFPDASQIEGAKELATRRRAGLSDDVGAGKTLTAILTMEHFTDGPTLILGPGLCAFVSWPEQLRYWRPNKTFTVIKSGKQLLEIGTKTPTTDYIICSIFTYWEYEEVVAKWKVSGIIIDEAHRIPHRKTTGFALLKRILSTGRRMATPLLFITASTIRNKPAELWRLYHILWPNAFSSFHDWKEKYFVKETLRIGPTTKTFYGDTIENMEGFQREYDRIFLERKLKVTFPAPVYEIVRLEMETKQQKLFTKFRDDKWAELSGEDFLYNTSPLTELVRLNVIGIDPRALDISESSSSIKHKWFADWSESHDETVLVGTSSAKTLKLWKKLGILDEIIDGETSKADLPRIVQEFNSGKIRKLGITFKLAESITLTKNRLMVVLDYFCTPENYRQFIGRSVRRGQEGTVRIYNLVCSDVDEKNYNRVKNYDSVNSEIRRKDSLPL